MLRLPHKHKKCCKECESCQYGDFGAAELISAAYARFFVEQRTLNNSYLKVVESLMLTNIFRSLLASAPVLALVLSVPCSAGIITGVSTIAGPGLGTVNIPVINTPNPGNDDQPGPGPDNNITVPIKRFDSLGAIDIEFSVVPNAPGPGTASPTTEYVFFESVDNNTGVDWDRYRMVLGFGVGTSFSPAAPSSPLDFDGPPGPPATSSVFSTVTPGLAGHTLNFSDGLHSSGSETYELRIDVPNGISSFTLRQIPIAVPEPATMAMLAFAMVASMSVARRRGIV